MSPKTPWMQQDEAAPKIEVMGVEVLVPWGAMGVGDSVFIPCVDTRKTARQVLVRSEYEGIVVVSQTRIEQDKLGLRVWRTR